MIAQKTPKPLTGTQEHALNWFREHGPVERSRYRRAGLSTGTVNSLIKAGLVEMKDLDAPRWRVVYVAIKSQGDAEIIAAKAATGGDKP